MYLNLISTVIHVTCIFRFVLENSLEARYDLDLDIWWDNFESIGTGTEK
jgi:hypothetical protein